MRGHELSGRLHAWLASHDGVVAAAQFHAWDVPAKYAARLVQRGVLVRIARGVYRAAAVPASPRQLLVAASLVEPRCAAGGASGCRHWQVRGIPGSREHVIVPGEVRLTILGLLVTRSRHLGDADVVTVGGGLRVTTPARSVIDAASLLGRRRTEAAIEQLLHEGLVTLDDLTATLDRLGGGPGPGRKLVRSILAGRDAGPATESNLERRVLAEIRRQRLPEPERQFVVRHPAGRVARFDFAWPRARLALEVDHATWHGGAREVHLDKERDRWTSALGWQTLRLTEVDVAQQLRETVALVGRVLADRLG